MQAPLSPFDRKDLSSVPFEKQRLSSQTAKQEAFNSLAKGSVVADFSNFSRDVIDDRSQPR